MWLYGKPITMSKKQFKDTTVGQLLFGAASVINPTLGNILQGVTSPKEAIAEICLLYTSPSPRDTERSRMPSSA